MNYFTSDEIENLNTFKELIQGIYNILVNKYNNDAKSIFSECINSIYEFADTHECEKQKKF